MKNELSREIKIDHIDSRNHIEKITASEDECDALSQRFDVQSIESLTAEIKTIQESDHLTYHVTGHVTAKIQQKSVISGVLITYEIAEDIESWFVNHDNVTPFDKSKLQKSGDDDGFEMPDERDDPEIIKDGVIDVGEVCAQFLGLAIDQFPKEGDEEAGDYIEVKPEGAKPNPFAKLAELKAKE